MLQNGDLQELRRGSNLARHELSDRQRSRLLAIFHEPQRITGHMGFPSLDTR
jgi:hypothetical protein